MDSNCFIKFAVKLMIGLPILVLMIVCYRWILWLRQHEKECECAKDWRRDYISVILGVMLVVSIASWIFFLYQIFKMGCQLFQNNRNTMSIMKMAKNPFIVIVSIIMYIAILLYAIFALQYVRMLQKKKCECATKGISDNVLMAHSIIILITYGIVIFTVVLPMFLTLLYFFAILAREAIKKRK